MLTRTKGRLPADYVSSPRQPLCVAGGRSPALTEPVCEKVREEKTRGFPRAPTPKVPYMWWARICDVFHHSGESPSRGQSTHQLVPASSKGAARSLPWRRARSSSDGGAQRTSAAATQQSAWSRSRANSQVCPPTSCSARPCARCPSRCAGLATDKAHLVRSAPRSLHLAQFQM